MMLFLALLNSLLSFTLPIFAINVFDRVIPSGNVNTLVIIGSISLLLIWALSMVDTLRTKISQQAGVNARAYDLPFVPIFLSALYIIDPKLFFVGCGISILSLSVMAMSPMWKNISERFINGAAYVVVFSFSAYLLLNNELSAGSIIAAGFLSQRVSLAAGLPKRINVEINKTIVYYMVVVFTLIGIVIASTSFQISGALTANGRTDAGNWTMSVPEQRKGKIFVEKGDHISKDQVIAVLDTTLVKSQLEGYEAQAKIVQIEIDRIADSVKKKFVPQIQLTERELRLVEITSQINSANNFIDQSVIKSPVNGIVYSVKNTNVLGGHEPFIEIVPDKTPTIEAEIPEGRVQIVEAGQRVRIQHDEEITYGSVFAISPDSKDGFYTVQIIPDKKMRTGQSVAVFWSGDKRTIFSWLIEPIKDIVVRGLN